MRRVVQTLAALALFGLVAGGAVVGFGLYDVSARTGHLPGVSWLLHTTFRNSVRLRAAKPRDMPDLSDPGLIELGARHYDAACRPCHAAPGAARTATMVAMVPAPPPIGLAVRDWQPHQLHWIVANGIKMSGMPPWPAARDDDVWPVVAFLTAVQRGLDAGGYARLTHAPDAGGAARAYCLGCHGPDGPAPVPRLGAQSAAYLKMSLAAYLDGSRASGIMAHAVTGVAPETLDDLAAWFAARPAPAAPPAPGLPAGPVARGRALALAETGDGDVPACRACHGPGASRASPYFPVLAGLPAGYLGAQLRLWRDGTRSGGARSALMARAAQNLDDAEIAALAAYYASLRPDLDEDADADPGPGD